MAARDRQCFAHHDSTGIGGGHPRVCELDCLWRGLETNHRQERREAKCFGCFVPETVGNFQEENVVRPAVVYTTGFWVPDNTDNEQLKEHCVRARRNNVTDVQMDCELVAARMSWQQPDHRRNRCGFSQWHSAVEQLRALSLLLSNPRQNPVGLPGTIDRCRHCLRFAVVPRKRFSACSPQSCRVERRAFKRVLRQTVQNDLSASAGDY